MTQFFDELRELRAATLALNSLQESTQALAKQLSTLDEKIAVEVTSVADLEKVIIFFLKIYIERMIKCEF